MIIILKASHTFIRSTFKERSLLGSKEIVKNGVPNERYFALLAHFFMVLQFELSRKSLKAIKYVLQ